ncbi:hypothetical protein HKX48_005714 [Thoreauomyces humboldtii]|nr:hypothetical protein HKX48_005714 [Thoreauomyces humboldtii]
MATAQNTQDVYLQHEPIEAVVAPQNPALVEVAPETIFVPVETTILVEDNTLPTSTYSSTPAAHEASLGETVSNAAASARNVAGQAADVAAGATRSAVDAVNQSGAIPKAKEVASNLAASAASGVRSAANAVSNATAPAPTTSYASSPIIDSTPVDIQQVEVPVGATVIVPHGTRVVEADEVVAPTSLASSVAGAAANAAGYAKDAAGNLANRLFGTNSATPVQDQAIAAKEAVVEATPSRLPTAQESANYVRDTSYAVAPETTAALANATDRATASAIDAKDRAVNTAYNAKDTAVNAVQDKVQEVRTDGIAPIATSVLTKAGSIAGTVLGSLGGTVVAGTRIAGDAAATALGRQPITTEGVVLDIPGETILEDTPRERGVLRAHEIERKASNAALHAAQVAADKKNAAVDSVVNSAPIVAATGSARQAYDTAQVNTVAAATLAGDAAHIAYEKAAHTAGIAKDVGGSALDSGASVAGTVYGKGANVAGSAYNTGANVAGSAYNTGAQVAGSAYNTGAHVAGSAVDATKAVGHGVVDAGAAVVGTTVGATKAVGHGVYDTTAAVVGGAVDATKYVAGTTYNAGAAVVGGTVGAAKTVTHAAVDTTKNVAAATYNTGAAVVGGAADATKNVASATYNTGAAVAGTAVDATKSAANTAYNTVAPKKTSTLPASEGHLGSPAGIAGAYGNSAPSQATNLESDSAISAVFIPANERTSAQQAAVDAALNRSLEPVDVTTVETPTSTTTTTTYFSPTAEILSAPITEVESAPIPSYASTQAYDAPIVSSVLPSDLTARELASPPSDGMSARSIPTSSIEERYTAPAPHSTPTTSTYNEQRFEAPSSAQNSSSDLVEEEPVSHDNQHVGLMSKLKGKVSHILHKDHVDQPVSDKHHAAGAAL